MIEKLKSLVGGLAGKKGETESPYDKMTLYELDVVRSSIVQDITYFTSKNYDISMLSQELISLSRYSNIQPDSLVLMSQIRDTQYRMNIFKIAQDRKGEGMMSIEFKQNQ